MEIEVQIEYKQRKGVSTRFGFGQEIKMNVKEFKIRGEYSGMEEEIMELISKRQSMAAKNEFNPYGPIDYSFQLLCAGIEVKQPQFSIQDNRFVMDVQMRDKPLNIDYYCDSEKHRE